jgi:hypothetical protein
MRALPRLLLWPASIALAVAAAEPALAGAFAFSTSDHDGKIATASRPSSAGKVEIESADDFILPSATRIDHATFTGLLPVGASATIGTVTVEIYRVFPKDSDLGRTSGPATFSTAQVPTRVNSPSDVAFASRSTGSGLSFSTTTLSASFTASNSIINGINPIPNQTTGGEGSVTGQEIEFSVSFTTPIDLPADHYFFVPQVELSSGDFFWLSTAKPIGADGTPFSPDLQSWIRDGDLDPDWLRVGTDIVGGSPAPTFNAAFSIDGTTVTVAEPSTLALLLAGGPILVLRRRRR